MQSSTPLDARSTVNQQALDSPKVREGLKDVLLGPGRLYEGLREQAERQRTVDLFPEGPVRWPEASFPVNSSYSRGARH
jgi:hypothetical protein